MDYLRIKGGYGDYESVTGLQWEIVTGGSNSGAMQFIDDNLDQDVLAYFSSDNLGSLKNMSYSNYALDMPHMVATIQGELIGTAPNDWSGWAADLASMMKGVKKYGGSDYYQAATDLLGGNSRFGQVDIDSDVDGRLIANMMMDDRGMLYSEALTSYYVNGNTSNRYADFVDYYGGSDGLRSAIDWSVNRPLITIAGGNASEAISSATKDVFYEYILRRAGY